MLNLNPVGVQTQNYSNKAQAKPAFGSVTLIATKAEKSILKGFLRWKANLYFPGFRPFIRTEITPTGKGKGRDAELAVTLMAKPWSELLGLRGLVRLLRGQSKRKLEAGIKPMVEKLNKEKGTNIKVIEDLDGARALARAKAAAIQYHAITAKAGAPALGK